MNNNGQTASIGLIGCGNISRRYVEGMARFPNLQLVGCSDIDPEIALKLSSEIGISSYATVEELLSDPKIDLVVNITPPNEHANVTISALEAGKNVYVEKPMAVSLSDAQKVLEVEAKTGNRVAAAPDTFLGSAAQTARTAVDRGLIGEPIAAVAFITHSRAETWHPNPTFLFQPGGGPLLDLGPYYVTSLVNLLGPVAFVHGNTRIGVKTRQVTSPNRTVETIDVTTPTHAAATLRFRSGVIGTLVASFDIWASHLPRIEVYGSAGTLSVPDPNQFDGPVELCLNNESSWKTLDPVLSTIGEVDGPDQMLRGFGVADLVASFAGEPLRVSAELAFHVLEVLQAVETSSETGQEIAIESVPSRPEPRV